jgi:hypothetical protein
LPKGGRERRRKAAALFVEPPANGSEVGFGQREIGVIIQKKYLVSLFAGF